VRILRVGAAVATAAVVMTGVAWAGGLSKPKDGAYGANTVSVQRGKTVLVGLTVVDHGTTISQLALQCGGSGDPSQGIPSNTTITVNIPGTLPISREGQFSFTGTVTLTAKDTGSNTAGTTPVTIAGKFVLHKKIKPNKTIAAKGTVTVGLCALSYDPKTFELQLTPPVVRRLAPSS
jgi:hypothetical protein